MLETRKFKKLYNGIEAFRLEDLLLPEGIYWIKGNNGSGKSTFLKSVGGVIPFDGDLILTGNISLKKNPTPYRKLVNFAEAEPQFPSFLKGKEMIDMFLEAKKDKIENIQYLIDSMEIGSFLNNNISSYSSGMLKKLSLILAFVGRAKLILLDEPFITLDSKSVEVLNHWITIKNLKEFVSFFITSHQDLEFGALPASKTIVVEDKTFKKYSDGKSYL